MATNCCYDEGTPQDMGLIGVFDSEEAAKLAQRHCDGQTWIFNGPLNNLQDVIFGIEKARAYG